MRQHLPRGYTIDNKWGCPDDRYDKNVYFYFIDDDGDPDWMLYGTIGEAITAAFAHSKLPR